MNLKITNQPSFKKAFKRKWISDKLENHKFGMFINKLTEKNTAYVVGGYLRDIQIGKKSRDIDIIVDMEESELDKVVLSMTLSDCKKNRMGGYKLVLGELTIDFWSIETNWAFKNELVKFSEKYILDRIGKGCFYNFDSLVINIKTLVLNVKFFNRCISSNQLDILMAKPTYKSLNPTKEANILRAFYLKKKFNFDYSEALYIYLKRQIFGLSGKSISPLEQLIIKLEKYEKYKEILDATDIEKFMYDVKMNKSIFSGSWEE